MIGFLSGFSERFAQDFMAQADRILEPGRAGRNGAAAPTAPKT